LDAVHQATIQRVMLRMVTLEGGERTRRRVLLSELDYGDPHENARVVDVIQQLVAARLLVTGMDDAGAPYVEPAHAAWIQARALAAVCHSGFAAAESGRKGRLGPSLVSRRAFRPCCSISIGPFPVEDAFATAP
jgi:hypothetical protein